MQYRLRTLVILTIMLPPLLAWLWHFWPAIIWFCSSVPTVLGIMTLSTGLAAVPIAVLALVFARIADTILHVGRHAENRR
jgi:thiamine transporter ThiT